jgi:glyoxylase-like metal-dependent hydrolase (beta-lactamase superfamily II)/rhodanese-related sulfurtransferase
MSQSFSPLAFVDEGLGNSSYLVDLGDGRALAIDPSRDPSPYLEAAEKAGLKIAFAAETHLHADFVSGSAELAAFGAHVLAPAAGGLEFPHNGVGDGDEIDLGGLRLRTLASPGHTPEHVAYLLLDDERPVALFSGGSLMVGSVARTDLISPDRTEELSRALWRSLNERILVLPDDLPVFPTHGAGSFCAAPTSNERTTTIGRERMSNPLLAAPDEDAFVKQLLAGLGTFPPYFLRMREVNRRGVALYGPEPPALTPLSVEEFRRVVDQGALPVDVRPIAVFATGHVPGSISNALRPAFGTWLGWLAEPQRSLVFVLGDDQDRADVVRQARKVGFDAFAGELAGGMAAWEQAGLAVAKIPLVAPADLDPARDIDVRQLNEWREGHVPDARHIELGSLAESAADLPAGALTISCGHGERAMTAASLLAALGRRHLSVLAGGPADWAAATGQDLVR